jgi:choline dehydrogenase
VAALKRARQAWASPAVSPVLAGGGEIVRGAAVTSDADLLAYIRSTVSTIWHASSTSAMGKATDALAVVDSKARVLGVAGLRIVDASVFPRAVPGHPQATIYALAEKMASDILNGS